MTHLTPCDPKGYRNYNQGSFSNWPDLMLSWLKDSSALCHFQADPFTSDFRIRLRPQRSRSGMIKTVEAFQRPQKKSHSRFWHCCTLTYHREANGFPGDPRSSLARTRADSHSYGGAAITAAAASLSSGKEPHSAGSYDSAFGFSANPPAHLWGPWGSLASNASLISTCQLASCCVWIQGMSGATSRSHSKWQDESEGQGLAYGSD